MLYTMDSLYILLSALAGLFFSYIIGLLWQGIWILLSLKNKDEFHPYILENIVYGFMILLPMFFLYILTILFFVL